MTTAASHDISIRHLRWIGRTGWVLLAAWSATLLLWAAAQPDPYLQGWRLVVELAFLGRIVNVADGVTMGFSRTYLLIQSGFQDIILLLVAYPPVVKLCEGVSGQGFFGRQLELVHQTARRHKARVEPLGAIGLWIFVFFPFWSTGALVGGVVGYLVGMRTWVVFTAVCTGHVISVVTLVYFLDAVATVAESFDAGLVRFLPWIILGLLLLGTGISGLVSRARRP